MNDFNPFATFVTDDELENIIASQNGINYPPNIMMSPEALAICVMEHQEFDETLLEVMGHTDQSAYAWRTALAIKTQKLHPVIVGMLYGYARGAWDLVETQQRDLPLSEVWRERSE